VHLHVLVIFGEINYNYFDKGTRAMLMTSNSTKYPYYIYCILYLKGFVFCTEILFFIAGK